mmetsp:Transcript_2250/g.6099  ORF Transcript_2250/g.6099 Transcript_2250/m.6099 type:complete len:86 (+) Transcript_2250:118-375(+)
MFQALLYQFNQQSLLTQGILFPIVDHLIAFALRKRDTSASTLVLFDFSFYFNLTYVIDTHQSFKQSRWHIHLFMQTQFCRCLQSR